jgi:hypothetical protein
MRVYSIDNNIIIALLLLIVNPGSVSAKLYEPGMTPDPLSYARPNQPDSGGNFGFIAQAVEQSFPEFVSAISPTNLTPGGTLTLSYQGLIAPLVKVLLALATEVDGFKERVTTNELCVGSTCIDEAQLQTILEKANESSAAPIQYGLNGTDASSKDDTAALSSDTDFGDSSDTSSNGTSTSSSDTNGGASISGDPSTSDSHTDTSSTSDAPDSPSADSGTDAGSDN